MTKEPYRWKRFWCPRDGKIDLSDEGYLSDPESDFGRILNPDVVPFEAIEEKPCLVLVGEPGIGKTYSLNAEREAIQRKINSESGNLLWLDLRSFGDEYRLHNCLFENQSFQAWRENKKPLYIFLDSFDECLMRIKTIAALLVDEFQKYPTEGLFLRIACRTADWPTILEDGLKKWFGEDSFGVYELVPLRRRDVAEAAGVSGLDSDVFLNEIRQKEIIPLAIKPITLKFLINTYCKTKGFPSTQIELYEEGCRLLCEETNQNRIAAGLRDLLNADQKMAIAARIAAVTIFSNKNAIWTGLDFGDVPSEDVTIQELIGESESLHGQDFNVTENSVKETLGTGLFSSRGSLRMGWAHQTYAEFLAAFYLKKRHMPLPQVMSLIAHPGGPEKKLVPQLHGVAAWLAGMMPGVFQEILKTDTEVLLKSDISTAHVKDKKALVEALLSKYDTGEFRLPDLSIIHDFQKLNYPGLADKIKPYIVEANRNDIAKMVAIEIAEDCNLHALQDDLLSIAMDTSQKYAIRKNAASAVNSIADSNTKVRLKPLVLGEGKDDPNDELKGLALKALWPDHLSAKELFANLTPPKRGNFVGTYYMFIKREILKNLKPIDMPVALAWIREISRLKNHLLENLVEALILEAWKYLESPVVAEAFTRAALSRIENDVSIIGGYLHSSNREEFENQWEKDNDKRRRILEFMIPVISEPRKLIHKMAYGTTRLLLTKDIPWMIERLRAATSEDHQSKWALFIKHAIDWHDLKTLDEVLTACQDNKILDDLLSDYFKPIEMDSPRAQKLKEEYRDLQQWEEKMKQRKQIPQVPLEERIILLLDRFESGNTAAWWHLTWEMTREPNRLQDELTADLTSLPGWKELNAQTRRRMVEASKKYVLAQDPENEKWFGTNTFYRPAAAGYNALRLLMKQEPDIIPTIPLATWKKWTAIILDYPSTGIDDKNSHNELLKLTYQHAPDEFIQSLMIIIDKENSVHDELFIIDSILGCWDERLARALMEKVKDAKLKPGCMGALLRHLLDNGVEEARKFALSLIPLPLPPDGIMRSKAIVAACALIKHAKDAGWEFIWPAMMSDDNFGLEVIGNVAHPFRKSDDFIKKISEDHVADLYIWLAKKFPYERDPKFEGGGFLGPNDSMRELRDSLLTDLKKRGTHPACDAIKRIMSEFPELDWLRWVLKDAQDETRRNTWIPCQPRDIIQIAHDSKLRLVRGGDQLLDVLIESLHRLEQKLQGETPAAPFLWNPVQNNVSRPRDENDLSNYVKIHFDEDLKKQGIIVNREVEIRRVGAGLGQRTDIHVDAIMSDHHGGTFDSITAIIEVKCCWNPGLWEAMETQLRNRYMKHTYCRHGIYLVGWFQSDRWDSNDTRKRPCETTSMPEAQTRLDVQANELSKRERVCIKAFVINASLG